MIFIKLIAYIICIQVTLILISIPNSSTILKEVDTKNKLNGQSNFIK